MTGITPYSCTPRQLKKHIIRCMKAGLVAFIQSSPAMGKSALVRLIAKEFNLKLIDHRLSTSAPEDLSGLPHFENGRASFLPFDMFPLEGDPLPLWEGEKERKFDDQGNCINCYAGWLVFLDEFNSATKMVQAAAYKLVLDHEVGQRRLHPNVVKVCAGNLSTDRAIVNPLGTAMQSRLVHFTMELNFQEFLEDVMLPQKWDSRIIAYLSYKPSMLHDFRPDHSDKTFCAPRTWEFMDKLVKGNDVVQEDAALYAGAITSGVALDFIQFTSTIDKIPKLAEIVKNPTGANVPTDGPTRWMTITHLVEHVNDDNFDPIAIYVNRLPAEFRVLFYRSLMVQKPELRKHQAFRSAMVELVRYLHDDDTQQAA